MNKDECKLILKTCVSQKYISKEMEMRTKYTQPLIWVIKTFSFKIFSNWILEARLLERALNKKWACARTPASYTSPLIQSLRKIWYNPYRIRKYKRWCKIQESMHVPTLKVNLGYIVYNSTQNKNNLLQSYWNTKTKDHLQESVKFLIF